MNKDLDVLFTHWKIGNCEIKNRIVITSMGGTSIFGWMEPKYKKLKKPMTQTSHRLLVLLRNSCRRTSEHSRYTYT